jgi:hypothetical protein
MPHRHRLSAVSLAAIPLLLAGSHADATIIAQDQFLGGWDPEAGEYSSGFILGQNPSLPGWSVPWTKPDWGDPNRLEFNPAGLLYRNLDCRGGHAEARPFTRVGRVLDVPFNDAASGTFYLSFLMRVPNSNPFNYKAFELHDGGYDDNTHRKLQLGLHSDLYTNGNFGLRLFNNNGFKLDLGPSNTRPNLFVIKFVFSTASNGDSVTVWRNPTALGSAEPPGGLTLSGFNMGFDRTTLAHFENGFDNPSMSYDELRLGTSWAVVTPVDPRLVYDFDDGAFQGWTQLTDPGSPQQWAVAAGGDSHSGSHAVKQQIPGGNGDSPHATLWLRSPEFTLNGTGDLTLFLMGGGFNSNGLYLGNESDVPANSVDTADSEGGGVHGVFLRNAATGEFVWQGFRLDNGINWAKVTLAAADLELLDQDATYTLDLIDARHGSWGWCNMDTVRIPGTLIAGPQPFQVTQFDYDHGSKTYRLTWNSQPGHSYTLRYTTDLATPGTVVQTAIPSGGATTTWPPVGDPPAASPLPSADRLFFYLEEIPD